MRFQIGEVEVSRVADFVVGGLSLQSFLPEIDDATISQNLDWLAPCFLDAVAWTFDLHVQSWLLRTRHHTILVDSCVGAGKTRLFPPFNQRETGYLSELAAAGVAAQDIDFVFCTHLHSDHVGWNTRLDDGRWVPTFPNAKYLFAREDYEKLDPRRGLLDPDDDAYRAYYDSVLPVVEAGQVEFVEGVREIGGELTIFPAPGHTPGHSALRLEDSGESALFVGDAMHHPVQIVAPHLSSFACVDAKQARQTRENLLAECCERHSLIAPAHFAAPHCGRVTRAGAGFRFHPGV